MPNKTEVALELLQSCSGACIASNADGKPEASYVPFIWMNERIYILISELAGHTQNLKNTPYCSLLLLKNQDADTEADSFARPRMSLKTSAEFIGKENELWTQAIEELITRHGKTAEVLASLPDFHLVALQVKSGTLIEGFGKAFRFQGSDFNKAKGLTGR